MTQNKILVVDDELMVLRSVQLVLESDGYAVAVATGAEAALKLMEQEAFDLVITDYTMPGMHGDELATLLKKQRPTLPIIMITGNPPSRPCPAIDLVVLKPFDQTRFRNGIRDLLKKARPESAGQ